MKKYLNYLLIISVVSLLGSCTIYSSYPSSNEDSQSETESFIDVTSESTSEESSSEETSESESEEPVVVYDEEADSIDGVDTSDFSELYSAFDGNLGNYTSEQHSYFNAVGLKDYYRHYQKNYVNDKTSIYTENTTYTYPENSSYLDIMNTGYFNKNNNLYSFSLTGDDIETRLSSSLTESDLTLCEENKTYQDNIFTLEDLNETYFISHGFERVSQHKYQSTEESVCDDFISITSYGLENEGSYMTFKKVTIELLTDSYRIRLYASSTQSGKLDANHFSELYPNWYLLFSEAYITNIGNTTFTPTSNL